MATMFIVMVICLQFSGFGCLFFKTNIFRIATEKERGRYAHVLMNSHVLLLKHPNNLFEAKL